MNAPSHPPCLYRLPPLAFRRLRFTLRAREAAQLPPFQGSMLRGAFGLALKATACASVIRDAQAPCATCREPKTCLYSQLFETPIDPAAGEPPPFLRGITTAPHPYLFEPTDLHTELRAGEMLGFDILLFGTAIAAERAVLTAVDAFAEKGLGAGRSRFALAEVQRVEMEEGRGQDLDITRGTSTARELQAALDSSASAPSAVRLHFVTPLRLLPRGQLSPPLDPRALAFAILRRHLELAHFHGPDAAEIDWTFRPLLDAASRLRFGARGTRDLRLVRFDRFSHRQEKHVPLDGFVGTLDLEGDLAPLLPLLAAGEVIHVGKGAVFGLGRYVIEPLGSIESG